ncbi:MAG: sugar phosphate isomerase/epimerase, partial [Candidatus Brocadiia bacterium]
MNEPVGLKFGFSTNLFVREPLESALHRIAAAGFRHVEILADTPHAELAIHRPEDYAGLAALLSSLDLSVCNINANTVRCLGSGKADDFFGFTPSLCDSKPAARARRVDYTRRALELARLLGSPVCTITSGRNPTSGMRHNALSIFYESIGELTDYADELGVRLAIEYEPELLVSSFAQVRKLIEFFPMLHVNLDVGHSYLAGEDVPGVIRALGRRIANVHFEDIKGNVHKHLPPGEGDIDLEAVLAALGAINYEGIVTFELYSCTDRSVEALKLAGAYAASRR